MAVHPEVAELLASIGPQPALPQNMTAALFRAGTEASSSLFAPGREVARTFDLILENGSGAGIPVRVYRPTEGTDHLPIVLYAHGGGWVGGNLDSHDAICRSLCLESGCLLVAVDYRRAPEHRFPAGLEDCYTALEWLSLRGGELGGLPLRLGVIGDSAGANLIAATTLLARDRGGPEICFQVLVCPSTDLDLEHWSSTKENGTGFLLSAEMLDWLYRQYATDRENPLVSPFRAPDLSGLPPALVITAECDPLRDEGEAYGRRLVEAGVLVEAVRFEGQIHGFFRMDAKLSDAARAQRIIGESLASALGEHAT